MPKGEATSQIPNKKRKRQRKAKMMLILGGGGKALFQTRVFPVLFSYISKICSGKGVTVYNHGLVYLRVNLAFRADDASIVSLAV